MKDPDRIQSEDWQLEKQRILQGSKEEPIIMLTAQSVDDEPVRRLEGPAGDDTPDDDTPDDDTPDEEVGVGRG